jgi:hypothetical protein
MLQMSIYKPPLGLKPECGSVVDPDGNWYIQLDNGWRLSFGEFEVTPYARRLTMVRLRMAPNVGGELAAASVQGDGRNP